MQTNEHTYSFGYQVSAQKDVFYTSYYNEGWSTLKNK